MAQDRPKKNFEGKNKARDTYDADWVFVRNKHTKGPNHSAGAWMTKRQRKELIQDRKEARAYRLAQQQAAAPAAPATPTTPTTVPIPMDGGGVSMAGQKANFLPELGQALGRPAKSAGAPGVPSWWIGQAIQNPQTEEQKFANVANALLPSLAPEDQRTLANYLAQNNPEVFGAYASANFGTGPTEITDDIRKNFLSPKRAQMTLNLLERMKQASGVQDMGAGYEYLKNAVNLINQFTTNGVMTRENYQQFANAVANLNKNAGGELSSYANLAQLFNLPQFTAGPLVSNAPNNKLFG
jgi:hypothetical protein